MEDYKRLEIYYDVISLQIIIVATGKDLLYGGTGSIDKIFAINHPYTPEQLYQGIITSLNNCYSLDCDHKDKYSPLEKYLKIKGYSKAVRNKKLIILEWTKESGYKIIPMEKKKNNGYIGLPPDKDIHLGHELNKQDLFEAINRAIEISVIKD